VNTSPLPRIVRSGYRCFTFRRNAQSAAPAYFCSTVRPWTRTAAYPFAHAGLDQLEEPLFAPRLVVEPLAQADRGGGRRRQGVADGLEDLDPPGHVLQHVPAAGLVLDLLHRAGVVQVDHVVPGPVHDAGRPGHRVGVGPDDLPGHRVVLVADVDALAEPLAAVAQDHVQ
jgi:hypothetical protein